jgi:tetratricopeptide (TPR) repeat protein
VSAIRICTAVLLFLVVALPVPCAAPPGRSIARWVEDLASDDPATWRNAVERLWHVGRAAEPAVRAALRHNDPDVPLRARLILARFDWGLFPDTPAAVARLIERYRDGDLAQRKTAAEELFRLGRSGHVALQRLLERESDDALRRHVTDYLKRHYRPLLRDRLAVGDQAGAVAFLESACSAGNLDAVRDLAALWVLTGQTVAKARDLERRVAAGERAAAVQAMYLHRAAGNLSAARRLAEKAGDPEMLAGVLIEQEDFQALARALPPRVRSSPDWLATVLHHAGDRNGFEATLGRIPANEQQRRSSVLFFNDRPRQGIDAVRQTAYLCTACKLLALQGRWREALTLSDRTAAKVDLEQRVALLLEQAVLWEQLGEHDRAGRLLRQALDGAEKLAAPDRLLGEILDAGERMGRREEVVAALGRLLDHGKRGPASWHLLYALAPGDVDVLIRWWDHLRLRSPDLPPSAILSRLRGWFERGQADSGFDARIADLEGARGFSAEERDRWTIALARTCVAVGKTKKAEEILRKAARTLNTAAAWRRVGDFCFERKRWAEAAMEYGRALECDRTDAQALYLRGVALSRAGKPGEGRSLMERARLLPLADEEARYFLAKGLAQRGLSDEAAAVRTMMERTAPFGSIYTTNAASSLAARAVRQGKSLEAARCYRRVYLDITHNGAFTDVTAELRVPALARLHQARGLLAAGKLDEALREGQRALEYLPEETGLVIDLVRALDRARRRAEADRLFDTVHGRLQRACREFPRAGRCHNGLAWLAVRCGRRLDEALRHAQAAATLAPRSPGYLDTLAEVHFQRGDRAAALALMKRVVGLAPDQPYFAAQLRRIEAGDRQADLPQR